MNTITFNIKLAGISVGIDCLSYETREFCAGYLTDEPCEFSVTVSRGDAKAEESADLAYRPSGHPLDPVMYELSAVQRKIAEQFPIYERFLIHGAAITYKNDAYLFCAPSGTGKSTHISLWKKNLGKDVDIVNGDKPFLSLEQEKDKLSVYVHGSPWGGKELWQKNRSAPLRAVCFLSQNSKNQISRLSPEQSITALIKQLYIPRNTQSAEKTLEFADRLLKFIPFYHLRCDISEKAVKCCFEELTKLKYPNK